MGYPMTALQVAEKRCTKCGETKPLSAFYRNRGTKDGLTYECAACSYKRVRKSQQKTRAELGDDVYRARLNADQWSRRQRDPDYRANERLRVTARNRAVERLALLYPDAYAQLLREERHKLGLAPDPQRHAG